MNHKQVLGDDTGNLSEDFFSQFCSSLLLCIFSHCLNFFTVSGNSFIWSELESILKWGTVHPERVFLFASRYPCVEEDKFVWPSVHIPKL